MIFEFNVLAGKSRGQGRLRLNLDSQHPAGNGYFREPRMDRAGQGRRGFGFDAAAIVTQ